MEVLTLILVDFIVEIFICNGMSNPSPAMLHESNMPSSSLPGLDNKDYIEMGEVVDLNGIEVYVVGNGTNAIIWNYDIFGFDSGRSRQLCDIFAEEGFTVIMPDYYRGTFQDPSKPGTTEFIKKQTNWDNLKKDWEETIRPFALNEKSIEKFGTIGTCWGSYMTIRLSSYPEVVAGVSMHPSHSPIMTKLGENEAMLLKQVKNQQLMMPSRTDSLNVKPGGLAEKILGNRLQILEFPEMNHGWTTRGNLDDPKVERDVKKAVVEAITFFKNNIL